MQLRGIAPCSVFAIALVYDPLVVVTRLAKRPVLGVAQSGQMQPQCCSAIKTVVGCLEIDGHLGRNFLKGRHGNHDGTMLVSPGYNLRIVLNRRGFLLRQILGAIQTGFKPITALIPASQRTASNNVAIMCH